MAVVNNKPRGIAKLVRHGILNPAFVGSSPAAPAIEHFSAAKNFRGAVFVYASPFLGEMVYVRTAF